MGVGRLREMFTLRVLVEKRRSTAMSHTTHVALPNPNTRALQFNTASLSERILDHAAVQESFVHFNGKRNTRDQGVCSRDKRFTRLV